MAPKKAPDVHIALTTHPDADKGPSALQHALGLSITDKVSHESVRAFSKELKEKRRDIEAYYRTKANGTGIIDPLYKAYKAALSTMEAHCLPYDQAIKACEAIDVAYVTEQRMIEAEAQEKIRRKAEADETARREKEAAQAEAAALKLEASSNVLSEREQQAVKYLTGILLVRLIGPADFVAAAKWAGYKDPKASAQRLFDSKKINDAMLSAVKAVRIRAEAEAAAAKPVIVDVPHVESQIVDGGMRTYYSCSEDVDVMALAKAVVAGKVHVLALSPNLPYLNTQAKALKSLFPAAFDGCQLSKREGTVSR